MDFRYITPEAAMKGRFAAESVPAWKTTILCFRDLKRSLRIVRQSGAKPLGRYLLWGLDRTPNEEFVYEIHFADEPVGLVTRCIWGGPQAAILVEELAYLGVRNIISWSCAGSFDPAVRKGELIVAASAITTDGTSLSYTSEPVVFPDPGLLALSSDVSRGLSYGLRRVCAATTDAIYRETPEAVENWRKKGAQIVNMETSAFYAAGAACGVKCLWMGHITDCIGETWEDWFSDLETAEDASMRLCLEVAARLALSLCVQTDEA